MLSNGRAISTNTPRSLLCTLAHFATLLAVLTLFPWSSNAAGTTATVSIAASNSLSMPPACTGINVVDQLKIQRPDLHREILAAAAKTSNANAILWKIEKPNLQPSYLFGTMHVTDPRVTTLSPNTKSALAGSNLIALELADLSAPKIGIAIQKSPGMLFYTDGSRLDKKLSKADFSIAQKTLKASGIPADTALVVKPWFAYVLLALPPCETKRAASGLKFLDAKLAKLGAARNIPVIGLETPIQQLRALASLSDAHQLELLKTSLRLLDRREDMFETLIQLYLSRRLAETMPLSNALSKIHGLKTTGTAAFINSMVVKRNYGMRDKSLPLLNKGGAFIAVGALHLSGKTGLVALFRRAGYKVSAIE